MKYKYTEVKNQFTIIWKLQRTSHKRDKVYFPMLEYSFERYWRNKFYIDSVNASQKGCERDIKGMNVSVGWKLFQDVKNIN